ncbi:MAG TPA: gliding motility-associated C-terminal domain-containing protein, partial [Bacteroidales bacterium]|nr:gliding motility-associated C-terminal domain-containing protein [Bacteroidales bacterium]
PGTSSPTAGSVQVEVINTNISPVISGNSPLCENEMLVLTSTPIGGALGAQYIWYGPNGLHDTTALPTYVIPQVSTLNGGLYYVVASVNGCLTQPSTPVYITVKPQPATPMVFSNSPVCEGGDLVLYTTTMANSYHWTGPNGYYSNLPYPPAILGVTPLNTGMYTLYTTVNGCNSPDTTIYVVVTPKPVTPLIFSNSPVCDKDTLTLWATGGGSSYLWTLPSGLTTTTTDSMLVIAPVSVANLGDYKVRMIVGACTSNISLPETVEVLVVPPDAAYAGTDLVVCAGNDPVALAGNVTNLSGMWTTHSSAVIVSPTSPNTIVTNLVAGQSYELYWTLSNPACGDYSTDTMVIYVAQWPVATTDTIELTENESVTFYDLLGNDSLYGWDPLVNITFDPVNGLADMNVDQTLNYYPFTNFWGKDSLVYQVCLEACPEMCDRTMVYFNIKPYIWIPDIITPGSGDGNDRFTIVGIGNYPENELWIYNRWGQEVYHAIDYQNDWIGTWQKNNEDLPDGTYFYVFIDRTDGKLVQKGYITIHR